MTVACGNSLCIRDEPLPCIVTPKILEKAKAFDEIKVHDYNNFSVEFVDNAKSANAKIGKENIPNISGICDSALDLVGKTPMVRLSRFAQKYGLKCELLAKCDFLSIGGSVKDRIGKQMIIEAEQSGALKPGDTLVEATSGNTGIGLCLAAAVKGYRVLVTLPEKMSTEKMSIMKAFGAEVVRTPTEAPWDSLESHLGLAMQLERTLPNCKFLDQYSNPGNPRAHYLETAEEILQQCDGKLDVMVMTVGTGGTASGVAQKFRERVPNCKIVGVDPRGSILAVPDALNDEKRGQSYLVEGIGYDFIPPTLRRSLISEWVKTDDDESFRLARELIRLEGLLVGGSSGAAMAGVLKVAKHMKEGERCVVLLPDSARSYMTKFIMDDWMIDHGFYQGPAASVFSTLSISDLCLTPPLVLKSNAIVREAVKLMAENSLGSLIVVSEENKPVGLLTDVCVATAIASERHSMTTVVSKIMQKPRCALMSTPLADATRMACLHPSVAVVDADGKLIHVLRCVDVLKAV